MRATRPNQQRFATYGTVHYYGIHGFGIPRVSLLVLSSLSLWSVYDARMCSFSGYVHSSLSSEGVGLFAPYMITDKYFRLLNSRFDSDGRTCTTRHAMPSNRGSGLPPTFALEKCHLVATCCAYRVSMGTLFYRHGVVVGAH